MFCSHGCKASSPWDKFLWHHVTIIILPPGAATRTNSLTNLVLSGICSPLSIDHTRSNFPSSNGCSNASATWNDAYTRPMSMSSKYINVYSKLQDGTLSESDWAAARSLALLAWTGLRVIPMHSAPNLEARYLELPPIPHPTSTTLFILFSSSPSSFSSKNSETGSTQESFLAFIYI